MQYICKSQKKANFDPGYSRGFLLYVQKDKMVSYKLLYFTASWCSPCRSFSPIFEETRESFPGVEFEKVDIDEDKEMTGMWNITSVPTIILTKGDKEVSRQIGAISKYQLTKTIQAGVQS